MENKKSIITCRFRLPLLPIEAPLTVKPAQLVELAVCDFCNYHKTRINPYIN